MSNTIAMLAILASKQFEVGSKFLLTLSILFIPRYRKNHLLNTNDRFDYGNFRQLHALVQESSNILTHFVHVFTQSGTFVFYDNADPNVEVIITVKDKATTCAGVLVAPITEGNLRSAGVKNSEVRVGL